MQIRNIAIIAHVDHGKTKITDALLRQTGMLAEGESFDSDSLEKERGITIYSKNGAIFYKDTKINLVDTPGHADFGSEVERVLRSIDSVLLVVDAQEGPMPQTRFVLKKSLELGLKPILVINKIDKPAARIDFVQEAVFELFLDLGATDEQLDFKTVYTNAKAGIAKLNIDDASDNMNPLLDTILAEVKPASGKSDQPFVAQPFNLGYDNFLGRLAVARIYSGQAKSGDKIFIKKLDGTQKSATLTKIFSFRGLSRIETDQAEAGDIVMIAGISDINIGETICADENQKPLPAIKVDEPTITLNFLVNDSPFAGRDGKFVTSRQLRERLERELQINIGLKVDFSSSDKFVVQGRGELHIAILLENMRREGYELQVSQPHVIFKEENGQKLEPFEEEIIDVPDEMVGTIIETMGKRKAELKNMKSERGYTRLEFEIPTRGLLGYRRQFVTDTRGQGVLASRFIEFRPFVGEIKKKETGSLISMESGVARSYSLHNLEPRGQLYIGPNIDVYEGMVIGCSAKGMDIAVNPVKGKHLTNTRAASAEVAIQLTPISEMTLERGLEIMAEDEFMEVTPKNIRLRKMFLKEIDRVRAVRAASR